MAARKRATPQTVEGLLKALLVLSRTVDHVLETRAVETAARQPLSPSKVQILRLLGNRGGQMPSQVARFLGVTKSAVTQIIDSMVRDKLVTRRTAKEDRREVNLQLTKKGRDLYLAVRRAQRHYVRNAIRGTAAKSTAQWIESLNGASSALAQADEAYQSFCAQCGAHEDNRCVLAGGDAECLFNQYQSHGVRRKRTTSSKR